MDIVKRAYLNTRRIAQGSALADALHEAMIAEMIRLIKVRAYRPQDWPREFGPYPEELRKKAKE